MKSKTPARRKCAKPFRRWSIQWAHDGLSTELCFDGRPVVQAKLVHALNRYRVRVALKGKP